MHVDINVWRRRVVNWLLAPLLVLLALYAALLALLWWQQERLLFQPQVLPASHRFALPADVHEVWIDVPGARLNALHLRLPKPDGVVFFLHGNGGSLDGWFTGIDFFRRANVDLFMVDYRGYGKSTGRIQSQAQLLADVRAAWDSIAPLYADNPADNRADNRADKPAGKQRVIYGRSLGSGLAAELAADIQPELTILVSPYTSMAEVARHHYRWVPPQLLRYPLHTAHALQRVTGPVLLVHGQRDSVIPATHSQRLHAALPHTQLLLVPDAGHNDVHLFAPYVAAMTQALQRP